MRLFSVCFCDRERGRDRKRMASMINRWVMERALGHEYTCGTPSSAADTLETVVSESIGDVARGQDGGTRNSWFCIRGSFSNTFAYWRRVMTAAFDGDAS